jgi:hypothetical protein
VFAAEVGSTKKPAAGRTMPRMRRLRRRGDPQFALLGSAIRPASSPCNDLPIATADQSIFNAFNGRYCMRGALKAGMLVVLGMLLGMLLAPQAVHAAVNYFDTTKVVSGYSGTASCPYGWKLTGGGVYPLPNDYYGSYSTDEYKLTGSYPYGQAWKGIGRKTHGTYSSTSGWRFSTSNYYPRVYAICAA